MIVLLPNTHARPLGLLGAALLHPEEHLAPASHPALAHCAQATFLREARLLEGALGFATGFAQFAALPWPLLTLCQGCLLFICLLFIQKKLLVLFLGDFLGPICNMILIGFVFVFIFPCLFLGFLQKPGLRTACLPALSLKVLLPDTPARLLGLLGAALLHPEEHLAPASHPALAHCAQATSLREARLPEGTLGFAQFAALPWPLLTLC